MAGSLHTSAFRQLLVTPNRDECARLHSSRRRCGRSPIREGVRQSGPVGTAGQRSGNGRIGQPRERGTESRIASRTSEHIEIPCIADFRKQKGGDLPGSDLLAESRTCGEGRVVYPGRHCPTLLNGADARHTCTDCRLQRDCALHPAEP